MYAGRCILKKLAAIIFKAQDFCIVGCTTFKASSSSADICLILSQNDMYQVSKMLSHVTYRTIIFTTMTASISYTLNVKPTGSSETLVIIYLATSLHGVITQNTTMQTTTR
jgi:hypothetical protein